MILNGIAEFKRSWIHFYPTISHEHLREALKWNNGSLNEGEVCPPPPLHHAYTCMCNSASVCMQCTGSHSAS